MTVEIKACNFNNRKLGGDHERIYPLRWLDSPKKKRSPNNKHQFDGGAL
jgi:hypothetical protein